MYIFSIEVAAVNLRSSSNVVTLHVSADKLPKKIGYVLHFEWGTGGAVG
jgi:hypothetical protein